MPNNLDTNLIEMRLNKLERQNRRLRRWLTAMGVAMVGSWGSVILLSPKPLSAQSEAVPKAIEATAFILKDKQGRVRGSFDAIDGVSLTIKDPSGISRIAMTARDRDSYLFLNNGDGKQRALISTVGDAFGFRVNDAKGVEQASIMVNKKGPTFVIRDAEGRLRATLSSRDRGPALVMRDEHGRPRVSMMVDEKRGALFGVLDEKGKVLFQKP